MASFSSLSANLPSVTLRRPSNLVLDLPELLAYISRFLSQRDAVCCVLVCKAWFRAFEPIVWEHVETANNISPRDMERHAHEIKSLSLTGLQGLENVLRKCTRLETVILWPDAFEDEEDEDEEDEEVEDLAETEDECSLTAEAHAKHSGDAKGKGSDSSDAEGDGPLVVREADKEKVRRDSGIGEDTIGLVQVQDTEIALLSIQEAPTDAMLPPTQRLSPLPTALTQSTTAFQQQREQNEWLPRRRRVVYQSPLATLLLQNRNLRRVEVYVGRKSPGGSFWRALAGSSLPSNRVTSSLSAVQSSSSLSNFSPYPCHCPHLSVFQSLVSLQVYKHIEPFLHMCTRLESLDLERCALRQLEPEYYRSLWFPRMKELKFGRILEMSLLSQLLLMRQCPELQVLDWRVPRLGFPVDEFCKALEEGCWPRLRSLTFPESRLTDADLARIIHLSATSTSGSTTRAVSATASQPFSFSATPYVSALGRSLALSPPLPCPNLSTFAVRRSDFGERSFLALRRHFGAMKHLDLYHCLSLTSRMTQEILQSCPTLESFEGYQLQALDIIQGLKTSRYGCCTSPAHAGLDTVGWVCTRIRHLDIHITGFRDAGTSDPVHDHDHNHGNIHYQAMGDTQDESEKQWAVYSQLARLNKLTHLSIGGKCSSGAMNGASGMASSLTTTTTTGASIPGARDEEAIVGADGLALRLCSGLGQLHTLKELRVLRFTGLEQHLKDEDVEWMVENLPQLRVVQGRLHPDEQCQPRLDAILEKAEISTWTMYNHQHSPCRSQN